MDEEKTVFLAAAPRHRGRRAMAKLVFYRQKRYDGGIRTGVELDDDRVADWFDPGPDENDRVLLWYVDLRCEGSGVPDEPELVLDWLLEHGPIIRDGFLRCADHLRNGFDPDIYTVRWTDFRDLPPEVAMLIASSAIRRVDALEIGSHVLEIATSWDGIIAKLKAAQAVAEPC
jgi:hypothetical protein